MIARAPGEGERQQPGGREEPGDGEASEEPSALSRVVAVASGVVVLALLGYLAVQALRPASPASLTAEVVPHEIRGTAGAYYVPLEVRNAGGATAKEILVEVVLDPGDRSENEAATTAETTIDYLAGRETQRTYAIFARDPRRGRLSARVRSYQEP